MGRTILQIAYYLILRHDVYRDLGTDHFDRLDTTRTTKRLVRRLESLGYSVTLHALADAPAVQATDPATVQERQPMT